MKIPTFQHLGGEKSSQTNEEKNRSTTLGLSRHGGEELSSRVWLWRMAWVAGGRRYGRYMDADL
jgi:hypothetical protein